MEDLEVSARTVDEAVELALDELGVSESEVEIEVLSEGKSGIFGIGAEEAKIRVRLLRQPPSEKHDVAQMAKDVLGELLTRMQVTAEVSIGEDAGKEATAIPLEVSGDDLGILIGWRGETLSSLQYIVNLIVSRELKTNAWVIVDVEGYRKHRQEALRNLAIRIADRVKATGRSFVLEPMSSAERRIIHMALGDDPDVITQSIGEGESRKVVVSVQRQ